MSKEQVQPDTYPPSVPYSERMGVTFVLAEDFKSLEWYGKPAPELTMNQAAIIANLQSARIIASSIDGLASAVERLAAAVEDN
ncbi:MAG: hypothetical protein RLY86_394 [Pseudomonadota bacterium]